MATPSTTEPSKPKPKPKAKSFLVVWFMQYYRAFTAAVCVVLIALGYILLISPKIQEAKAVEQLALQKEREKQAAFEAQLKYLSSLQGKRAQTSEADINFVLNALPTEPGVPEFLASLESLARASGATIEGVSLSVLEPTKGAVPASAAAGAKDNLPPGVRVLEGNISVAATSYSQVKTLLANIEKSLRLMDTIALLYTPSSKTYTVAVQTYYQP